VSKWEREANELVIKRRRKPPHQNTSYPILVKGPKEYHTFALVSNHSLSQSKGFLSLQFLLACMLLSTGQWQKQQMNSWIYLDPTCLKDIYPTLIPIYELYFSHVFSTTKGICSLELEFVNMEI